MKQIYYFINLNMQEFISFKYMKILHIHFVTFIL